MTEEEVKAHEERVRLFWVVVSPDARTCSDPDAVFRVSFCPTKVFSVRRLLAIVLPALLLITACGGNTAAAEPTSQSAGDVSKLDSVKVTDNGNDKAPSLEFSKPLTVAEPTIKVLVEGDGERVKGGQTAELLYLAVDGNDGKTVDDAYANGRQPIELTDDPKAGNELIYNAIVGTKIGSHLAYAIPGSADGASELLILKVISAKDPSPVLEEPEGEIVAPPAGLPGVKESDNGIPEISVEGVAAPTELIAQYLIEGSGAAVKASDTLTVNYVGVNLADGKKFDSSFDRGQTASFALTGVIKGWTQGLEGKTIGSRVLLVIPQDLAYGETGQGEAKGHLVFVVDILGIK